MYRQAFLSRRLWRMMNLPSEKQIIFFALQQASIKADTHKHTTH